MEENKAFTQLTEIKVYRPDWENIFSLSFKNTSMHSVLENTQIKSLSCYETWFTLNAENIARPVCLTPPVYFTKISILRKKKLDPTPVPPTTRKALV